MTGTVFIRKINNGFTSHSALPDPSGFAGEIVYDALGRTTESIDDEHRVGHSKLFGRSNQKNMTVKALSDNWSNERHNRLGMLEEPMGHIDSANLYEFVGSGPLGAVDPAGLAEQLASRPASAPATGPTTGPATQPVIAGQGEHVISTHNLGSWDYPYTCNVKNGGLGIFRPALERLVGTAGVEAFAKALGLTPSDLGERGYSAIADFERARVRRDADRCERDVVYVDVSEFIAVPIWKNLHDWEKEHIEKDPIAADHYPKEKMSRMPNPAPGLDEWRTIREIMNNAGGYDSLTGADTAKMLKASTQRRKNALRIILKNGPWEQPGAAPPVQRGLPPPLQ